MYVWFCMFDIVLMHIKYIFGVLKMYIIFYYSVCCKFFISGNLDNENLKHRFYVISVTCFLTKASFSKFEYRITLYILKNNFLLSPDPIWSEMINPSSHRHF